MSLGKVTGSRDQYLQQKAATFELLVEDTGANTNPRRYEKDNGFVSGVIAVAIGPVATLIWGIASVNAVNPAAGGRTAGEDTTIYTIIIENATGAGVTVFLENGTGTVWTPDYHVNNNETSVISFIAGLNIGDQDIYINASAAAVEVQIIGTEA